MRWPLFCHAHNQGASTSWFNVDKQGLAAILERRGKFFAVAELISNCWDSGATRVDITLEPIDGIPYAKLSVKDNGSGIANLDHLNTMFTRSSRASDPRKRGRFNLGEKLVLALCRSALIVTRSGTVHFAEDGRVQRSTRHIDSGTLFTAEIRMTREELGDVIQQMHRPIPPVNTIFNGIALDRPDSLCRFNVKLPTELADADGMLRRSVREATVEVYPDETGPGEILEMGIPVVETENGYRVNVMQKIPLNMDRDNVSPAFLRAVQAALLNNVHEVLTEEVAAKPWVQEAMGDARATPEAVKSVVVKRFGDRAVVGNPSDPMSNARAAASGFTVVAGGSLSADAWNNVRKSQILLPSSKVFPSASPEQVAAAQEGKCPMCGKPV